MVLANTMSGRAVARMLLELGENPTILIDDPKHKENFQHYPDSTFRLFSWSSFDSIYEALKGGELLYYNIETGPSLRQQSTAINSALKKLSYKYVYE